MRLACASAWQEGYGAFRVSASQRDAVRRYIQQQDEHHRTRTFREEYLEMLPRQLSGWNLMNAMFNPNAPAGASGFLYSIIGGSAPPANLLLDPSGLYS
jgi:hypothetical protein